MPTSRMLPRVRRSLAVCCLIGALAACGGGTAQQPTGAAVASPATQPPPPAAATQPAAPATAAATQPQGTSMNPSGIGGLVVSASDVSGQPDQPLANQIVIAMPLSLLGSLPGGPGSTPSDRDLRFLGLTIKAQSSQIVVGVTDAQGRYSLSLPPGDYAVCLADSSGAATFPLTTRGCGKVTVPPATMRQIDISSGLGEIVLVAP
ncbi:MAG: hypothetical protein IPO81_23550 [Kouleothrix sp.]|nr:hypothetical protein [Kouleothrix sp.]